MPSFEHKQILDRLQREDAPPGDAEAYGKWVEGGASLEMLKGNTAGDEVVVYACGEYAYIHAVAVPEERLSPPDQADLLGWNGGPWLARAASYVWGGGSDEVRVDRAYSGHGASTLDGTTAFVFERIFEGMSDDREKRVEILQEYLHLANAHWLSEHNSYCRYDHLGDLEHVVSVTSRRGQPGVTLVSFRWEPLEEYLAATRTALVRTFDFTRFRPGDFSGWPDREPITISESQDFFYKRQIVSGRHGYTRGVQIIWPRRDRAQVFARIRGEPESRYVTFEAFDWRNGRAAEISTDPRATANYFTAEGNRLPFELSPAFFRPEVLLKYKSDRDKYSLRDRSITCRGSWYLKGIDVNKAGQVHVYICDLRALPYEEQLYWRSFNEKARDEISARAFANDFEGRVYAQPNPVRRICSIAEQWSKASMPWWRLRDHDLLARVTMPLTASLDEWADAFMEVSKLIVEGFEVSVLRQKLDEANIPYDSKDQSLLLIEKLSSGKPGADGPLRLEALRAAQTIRSKVKGHARGETGRKLAREAIEQHGTFAAHFSHVCSLIVGELERIERLLG